MIRTLADASDPAVFGGKAVQLGAAIRAGLPVPAGFAICSAQVDAVACAKPDALADLEAACTNGAGLAADAASAVRSSAIGEDSTATSFAGAHLTVLGVVGFDAVVDAVRRVHASGQAAGAQAYRTRMDLGPVPGMAVVVQELVDADVAGVLFTRDPVSGAPELVVEASWGLGEAVVAGLVIPDRYRLDPQGRLLQHRVGEKDVAIRYGGPAGTEQIPVAPELVAAPCLGAFELAALGELAAACDRTFGPTGHDIEFAFRAGALFLLQRRPITGG